MKKIALLFIFANAFVFAQKTDLEKNNILHSPKIIEESNEKGIIRTNVVEGYIQEYYIKTFFNAEGFISKIENYSEDGQLSTTDTYTYNDNKLISIERKNPEDSFIITKEYKYLDSGYVETITENDILIAEITYTTDNQGNIISQKEKNLVEEAITSERVNEYQNNKLTKTTVSFGKDGYVVTYKYAKSNIPSEEIVYDLKNKLVSKKLRKFDEKGNLIEENNFGSDGKLKANNRILYDFDEKGNWVKRTQYANQIETPISNTTRTIKY